MRTTDCEGWSVARGYVRKTEMEREGGREEGGRYGDDNSIGHPEADDAMQ